MTQGHSLFRHHILVFFNSAETKAFCLLATSYDKILELLQFAKFIISFFMNQMSFTIMSKESKQKSNSRFYSFKCTVIKRKGKKNVLDSNFRGHYDDSRWNFAKPYSLHILTKEVETWIITFRVHNGIQWVENLRSILHSNLP